MKLFIDSANVREIKEVNDWGIISGVTTNPSLIAREGRDFHATIYEIASIVNGPVSAEVTAIEFEQMIEEAKTLAAIHPNVVIKLPITREGLQACKVLTQMGLKTNLTLIFSPAQALLASLAGATYVSPFVGRLDDVAHQGIELVERINMMFVRQGINTQIIAASIRSPIDIVKAATVGANIATAPFKVIKQMVEHPLTELGIEKFLADWESLQKK